MPEEALTPTEPSHEKWYALWTHSHCERLVCQQLASKGFETFLPTIEAWSVRGGVRTRSRIPLFSGYLFLHHAMDHASYVEILKAKGLVQILGDGWRQLAVIPDAEINAIRQVIETKTPVLPHPHLQEGQRVRITGGALVGIEGILSRTKPDKGLLVLSIELFQRSIAVEVDSALAVAA